MYQNRFNAETDKNIPDYYIYFMSSKSDIAEICKLNTMTLFSLSCFVLESRVIFPNNMQFMVACNESINSILNN